MLITEVDRIDVVKRIFGVPLKVMDEIKLMRVLELVV